MTTKKFTLNTEPHVAEVGEHRFLFKPEMSGDEMLDAWAEMQSGLTSDDDPDDRSVEAVKTRAQKSSAVIRQFIRTCMLDESAVVFDDVKLPDRVLIEMQRWALEVYGLRPTGSSSGSSESASTSDDSTSSTPSTSPEASTS